jgi:N-acyl-D-aspartate/D-glutamate deacylase
MSAATGEWDKANIIGRTRPKSIRNYLKANMNFDLIIRGGQLADGSGLPLREADVAILDGRFAAVGDLRGHRGREEIDARDKLVTPGFVDIHTHYDGQALWDTRLWPSSCHGVTTAVMGNCGVGFAPVRKKDRQLLVELMEGVEDIPGAVLHEGLDWAWESFGEYLDALDARPRDIDIGAQLPHGALRVYVMGQRAARLEAATLQDIAQMREISKVAMRQGALGFSTSRSMNHRSANGDPTPGLRAAEDELTGIALGLQDAGRGVLQFISDFDQPSLEAEFAMLRRIIVSSGRPMSLSLAQKHSAPNHWRKLLDLIASAATDGVPITAQVAPRPIGVLLGLQGSLNPFSSCAGYLEIAQLPLAERVALLRTPALRQRLLREITEPSNHPVLTRLSAFDRIFPFGDPPDYEPPLERSIAAIAQREGCTPISKAYDVMLGDEGRAFLFAPFANYADGNLDVCREMIQNSNTVIGLGDGGAHVSIISDGSFPTYLLSHWGRDRVSGRFDLGWLVKRQTADTAAVVGLLDRGRVAPGYKADLNVIDFERLQVNSPHMMADLPAGGRRLLQGAVGYVATLVNGVPIYREGEPTGALPGKLIRGPQSV